MTCRPTCIWRFQKGVTAHEFGHALGFHHEQTRPDRDQYVRINTQNINQRMVYNFQKYDSNKINAYDVPYDYESIMHYGRTVSFLPQFSSSLWFFEKESVMRFLQAFSTNGRITIQTLDPKYQNVIGNRYGISFSDIKLINLMYSCNSKPHTYDMHVVVFWSPQTRLLVPRYSTVFSSWNPGDRSLLFSLLLSMYI